MAAHGPTPTPTAVSDGFGEVRGMMGVGSGTAVGSVSGDRWPRRGRCRGDDHAARVGEWGRVAQRSADEKRAGRECQEEEHADERDARRRAVRSGEALPPARTGRPRWPTCRDGDSSQGSRVERARGAIGVRAKSRSEVALEVGSVSHR